MNDSLADRIHGARFSPVRLREGYDIAQVDWFLDQLEEAVRSGRPIDAMVSEARFTTVRMREGYDMGEVDAFLETVRTEGAEPQAPTSEPSPTETSGAETTPIEPPFAGHADTKTESAEAIGESVREGATNEVSAAPTPVAPPPSVIQEVESPLRRFFRRRK